MTIGIFFDSCSFLKKEKTIRNDNLKMKKKNKTINVIKQKVVMGLL